MTSPYTATSRFSESEWTRILDRGRELLDVSLCRGGVRSHLFVESTLRRQRTLRQRGGAKRISPPSFWESIYWLEGASICVDGCTTRGFASSADIEDAALTVAAERASTTLAKFDTTPGAIRLSDPLSSPTFTPLTDDPTTIASATALETLRTLTDACFSLDRRIEVVRVLLDERITRRFVLTSEGFTGTSRKILTDVVIECRLSSGHAGRAVAGAAGDLWCDMPTDCLPREALDVAVADMVGREPERARMPVLLDAGWCAGVFVHELIGHQLEADNMQRRWGRIDRAAGPVCPRHVSVKDAPGRVGQRGSMSFDDEGCASMLTPLIQNGEAVGCLHDSLTARRANVRSNGHGRRQDYRFMPMPRMTNLVAEVDRRARVETPRGDAIRVHSLGGGHVDGETGQFTFDVLRADQVHRGEPVFHLSGIALTGYAEKAIAGMKMFGAVEGDRGRGVCVKEGQTVPISVAAPSILIEELEIVSRSQSPARYSL